MDIPVTGVYSVRQDLTAVTIAKSVIQINAPATRAVVLVRAWLGQGNSEVSTQEEIELLRVTTAGTGTAATPRPLGAYAAAASTATTNHTVEGTGGDSLLREAFNIVNGWLWIPTPMEGVIIPPSGRIALKFPVAPETSIDVTAGVVFAEIG